MSDQRLLRRGATYYYRRRVPAHLIKSIGKKVVQFSLGTTSFNEAKKLRAIRDIEWDARFEAAEDVPALEEDECLGMSPAGSSPPLDESELLGLVRDYVERKDQQAQKRHASSPPQTTMKQPKGRWRPSSKPKRCANQKILSRTSGFMMPARRCSNLSGDRLMIPICPVRYWPNGYAVPFWS